MAAECWIDDWAHGIARAEACRVRATVRRSMREGRALADVLAEVRRSLVPLTGSQRDHLVDVIGPTGEGLAG